MFAAQNMMYRHSITVYNKSGVLLAKISDAVNLKSFGHPEYASDNYLGGPVEAAFSSSGKYLWVSNYNMIGEGFDNPGCDACNGKNYDPGFVYKINTATFKIENAIKVGAVPKFLAISKDESLMIVSNWSSSDISVVDLATEKEIKKVDVGSHPRGVAISSDAKKAYITVMGSTKIAVVDLVTYEVEYITGIGSSPRHVVLSANDSLLYISLNSGNALLKYELATGLKQTCKTNAGPRTMILSPDQKYLYVVNYFSNTFSKVRTDSMSVVEVVNTGHHPIGITANWDDSEIWVACYEGKIEIFKDFQLAESTAEESFLFEEELAAFLELFQPAVSSAVETTKVVVADTGSDLIAEIPADDEADTVTVDADAPVIEKLTMKPKTRYTGVSQADRDRFQASQSEVTSTVITKTGTTEKANSAACSYHVIVGSFSIPENATEFKKTVDKKGYSATIINGSKLTYVSAQCFDSRESAAAAIDGIYADIDVKGWVLKR